MLRLKYHILHRYFHFDYMTYLEKQVNEKVFEAMNVASIQLKVTRSACHSQNNKWTLTTVQQFDRWNDPTF